MSKKAMLRPILVSALLFFAHTREGLADVISYSELFHRAADIVVTNTYKASKIVYDFPMLIRISPDDIPGFSYDLAGSGGANIRFSYTVLSDSGKTVKSREAAPCDIDTWNTDGVSLVWVKHPLLNNTTKKYLTMYWDPVDGAELPENNPADVWKGTHEAVWHAADAYDSGPATLSGSLGATAYALDSGAVGASLTADLRAKGDYVIETQTNDALVDMLTNAWTMTCWIKLDNLETRGAYIHVADFEAPSMTAGAAVRFTGGATSNATAITVYPGSSLCPTGVTFNVAGKINVGEWTRLMVMVGAANNGGGGGFAELWLNNKPVGKSSSPFGRREFDGLPGSARVPIDEQSVTVLFKGAIDEMRLAAGNQVAWATGEEKYLTLDVEQVTNAHAWCFGPTRVDDVLLNEWIVEPSLDPKSWRTGDDHGTITNGTPRYGTVALTYRNRTTGRKLQGMPTAKGLYSVTFDVAETAEYTGLTKTIDFQITANSDISHCGYASAYDFKGSVAFTVGDGVSGTLYDFPMLVRVKPGTPSGFSYEELPYGKDDIRFFDSTGKSLDYEIDTWRGDGDESVFWVRVPIYRAGETIRMCWGMRAGYQLPETSATGVWTNVYAGVWHFAEAADAATASTVLAADSTGHGYDGVPSGGTAIDTNLMVSVTGKIGLGRVNDNRDDMAQGNCFVLTNSDVSALAFNGRFSWSGWVNCSGLVAEGLLVSRSGYGADGFEVALNTDRTGLVLRSAGNEIAASLFENEITGAGWVYVATSFDGTGVDIYGWSPADGRAFTNRVALYKAPDVTHAIRFGGNATGSAASYCGAFDEVRFAPKTRSVAWFEAECGQVVESSSYQSAGTVTNDASAVLQNKWIRIPSITKTVWRDGDMPAETDIDAGQAYHGTPVIRYYDRTTGQLVGTTVPATNGEYRAVSRVEEESGWSELEYSFTFRIVETAADYDLGNYGDRTLLMNDDYSIDGARVECQSYDDSVPGYELPYWRHLDDAGNDADSGWDIWSENPYFNFGGGTRHVYCAADGSRIWDLIGVRFGNTFNNGLDVLDQTGGWEADDEGLQPNQNYLNWNPDSQNILAFFGGTVDCWHQFAGEIVMQNRSDAAICSRCYPGGLGTIYFDAVNGWSDNVRDEDGNANYRLVVEIATNVIGSADAPTDDLIASTYWHWWIDAGGTEQRSLETYDGYAYADWQQVPVRVLRFDDGDCTDLGTQDTLTLDITAGGTRKRFYRVYTTVNCRTPSRFRIRRVAIDPDYSLNPDGPAMILVDNVICSLPTHVINLEPLGVYDETKSGKQTLGFEGAFDPPFPSATDAAVFGRAKAVRDDDEPIREGSIAAATMHYRWRYLNQKFTDWQVSDLDPTALKSLAPLALPAYAGDVEFWYEVEQNTFFYKYADYSGNDLGLGDQAYGDAVGTVTNVAPWKSESRDWFVRMRDGKSDWAEMKIILKDDEKGAEATIEMEVLEDHLWRGFYRMTNAFENGIWWRVVGRNYQTAGDVEWSVNTSMWYIAEYETRLPDYPMTGKLSEGTADSWSRLKCDKTTGFIMFQLDDTSKSVTAIHADYQNFNAWNDARKDWFVGCSSDTNGTMKGTSHNTRDYAVGYDGWEDTPSTNVNWNVQTDIRNIGDAGIGDGYELLAEGAIDNWDIGKFQWVHGKYRDPQTHVAIQLYGNQEGWLAFYDDTILGETWPRGYESLSFNARIAQQVKPDLSVRYGRDGWMYANYTFVTRAVFDFKQNLGFTGNASLSLFGYFREGYGCYEARWEQVRGKIETTEGPNYGKVLAPEPSGQRLVILRWDYDPAARGYVSTELASVYNGDESSGWVDEPMPITDGGSSTNLMPFCISIQEVGDSETRIYAGVYIVKGEQSDANGLQPDAWSTTQYQNSNWRFLSASDTSASRHKGGTYGVLAANCEGAFYRPEFAPVPLPTSTPTGKTKGTIVNAVTKALTNCTASIASGWEWTGNTDRMTPFWETNDVVSVNGRGCFGFRATPVSKTLEIYTGDVGENDDWDLWDEVEIDGFGTPGAEFDCVKTFYSVTNAAIKLQVKGGLSYIHDGTDIAVSDVRVSQWRGYDDWPDRLDEPESMRNQYGRTNFIFTTGWVTNGAVQLSAKRTYADVAASVRSPLMDGYSGRGVGLGMIGFNYRNMTENCRLKVQIITNFTYQSGSLKAMSLSTEEGDGNGSWVTVTNLTHDILGNSGSYSYYFGLHGAKGLMRILVDPDLVNEVAGETNAAYFGSIEITDAFCRDEPPLDKGCWWGWNMQTIGDVYDTQRRMYLPDCTDAPGKLGLVMALNNSVTEGVDPTAAHPEDFQEHMPFLQSPTFLNAVVGQVIFKARMYELSDLAPAAEVAVYATAKQDLDDLEDKDWEGPLYRAVVSNDLFATYTFKTDPGKNYRAFRFAVTGVPGVKWPGPTPKAGNDPVRVVLDEVVVCEAVRAQLAFRQVGAFRSDLNGTGYVTGVTTSDEQPLCGENWGVQAEVYATMLGDEIDTDIPPRVKLHWYVGESPWGYENWKNIPADKTTRGDAWLGEVSGTTYVYRSSYPLAPDAVMLAQSKAGTVVQYELEVEYGVINATTGTRSTMTNWLDATEWSTPSWYKPVDYNADASHGKGETFAAYTILDTVAPGWAWINEGNFVGSYEEWTNSDKEFQYVEVCVPADADISGWTLRFLAVGTYGDRVTTNQVAYFGDGTLLGTKKDNLGMAQNKVFRSVGNKKSTRLSIANGTLDGLWMFQDDAIGTAPFCRQHTKKGDYDYIDVDTPFGVQLVRPSGIIEHSVVMIGTNAWGSVPGYRDYDPTNTAARLNALVPGSDFKYIGADERGAPYSLSVTEGRCEGTVWTNNWAYSPGYINTNYYGKVQKIDPDHPTPQGETIVVFASVDTDFGHIRQRIGSQSAEATTDSQMILVKRGSDRGTNIYYEVDNWYELKSVTTNKSEFWTYVPRQRAVEVTVGKNASNNVSVVATAQVDSDLSDKYGLDENNPYTPAALAWLEGGETLRGLFENIDGEIRLAEFQGYRSEVVTNMTLTEMYWLDMDPTVGGLRFVAGFDGKPITPVLVPGYKGDSSVTNLRMRVYMLMTNKNENASATNPRVWTPYVLRGIEPGATSWDYDPMSEETQASWTSETFKVTGLLPNGRTLESNLRNWIPLRWFVFKEDSFYQAGEKNPENEDAEYTTEIEIVDPHTQQSPGWQEWRDDPNYLTLPIFNSWSIDTRLKPVAPEVLEKRNWY